MEVADIIKAFSPTLEGLSKLPGRGAERLAALAANVNWDKVHSLDLKWESVRCDGIDELVPIVKMEFIHE